ncbi:MAG: GYF domain-containing protein [Planctomycetaceae bacterium]
MSEQWFYRVLGEEFGPVSRTVLEEMVRQGDLGTSDEVRSGTNDWVRAGEVVSQSTVADAPELDDELASMLASVAGNSTADSWTASGGDDSRRGWFCRTLGEELGPMEFNELCEMVADGNLSASDEVRLGKEGAWEPAGSIVGLFASAAGETAGEPITAESEAGQWYYEKRGKPRGPVSWDKLRARVAVGKLTDRDRIREGEKGAWVRAGTAVGLFDDLLKQRSIVGLAAQSAAGGQQLEHRDSPVESAAIARPAAVPAAEQQKAAESQPKDQWGDFFEKAEERAAKRFKRPSSSPASDVKSQKRSGDDLAAHQPSVSPSPAAAGFQPPESPASPPPPAMLSPAPVGSPARSAPSMASFAPSARRRSDPSACRPSISVDCSSGCRELPQARANPHWRCSRGVVGTGTEIPAWPAGRYARD